MELVSQNLCGCSRFNVYVYRLIINIVGISNVKSRESLVMTYTDMAEDPFSSAPFSLPGKWDLMAVENGDDTSA